MLMVKIVKKVIIILCKLFLKMKYIQHILIPWVVK